MGDSLNDVLQALKQVEIETNKDDDYKDDHYSITMDMDGDFWDDGGHMFKWDLTKMYLSDQSMETQNKINNFLK